MSDTSTKDETVTTGDTQTDATTTSTPALQTQDNAGTAEVERLRKEQEQKDLRIRQLENEAKAREKADEDAKAKELEQNQEYKTLLEQEREKRTALETEIEDNNQKAELSKAKTEVFKDYSEEVKAQAEKLGIDLTDPSETNVAAFKEKLDTINTGLVKTGTVTPNNPQQKTVTIELSGDDLREALQEDNSFHDLVVKKFPGIALMTSKQ